MIEHTVLSVIVGSRAQGLDTGESDVDRRGVYVPPTALFWRFEKPPVSVDGPEQERLSWEVEHFLALGLKVRGRKYLRIIYGPDYTEPGNIDRLRQRGLAAKRSLAAREYALGIEGLERLARGEPLWRVHECVFAVLALESEPVDPRL